MSLSEDQPLIALLMVPASASGSGDGSVRDLRIGSAIRQEI